MNPLAKDLQDIVKTVKVRVPPTKGNEAGVVEINATDYDRKKHTLVDEDEPELEFLRKAEADEKAKFELAEKNAPRNAEGLRLDGPTRETWIKAGYSIKGYPPHGYAAIETPATVGALSAGWTTDPAKL